MTSLLRARAGAAAVVLIAAMITWPAAAQNQPTASEPMNGTSVQQAMETWVATHTVGPLWSGPDSAARRIASLEAWTPLAVLAPQEWPRLQVLNPINQASGWVDATSVGPIEAPTLAELAQIRQAAARSAVAARATPSSATPAPVTSPPAAASTSVTAAAPSASSDSQASSQTWWAMTHQPAVAWSGTGPDATAQGELPMWRYIEVLAGSEGERFLARDPRSGVTLYVDPSDVGRVGPPPQEYFEPAPPDHEALALPARIVGSTDVYERPSREPYFALDRVTHNQPVTIQGMVEDGADSSTWYRIADERYVPAGSLRLPAAPDRTWPGRWIDASLSEPAMITAYEGDRPVYSALAVKGARAFQTPTGVYRIQRRVQNEIMDSATIGIPRESPLGYYLKDVLYTQYFTGDGAAIHYNYWRSDWGYGASKGCLGLNLSDSEFFWDFATVGTIIYIHN